MEQALEDYMKEHPSTVIDILHPVDPYFQDTPYMLCAHVTSEPKETYNIHKVVFQRSMWISDTQIHYCFVTPEEKEIYISNHDLEKGYAEVYSYTKEYRCKGYM